MPQSSAPQATSKAGLVGIELVGNEDPFCFGVSGHGGADAADKVLFRAGVSEDGADHFAGGRLKVRYQRLRPMSGVLEFVQFRPCLGTSAGQGVSAPGLVCRFFHQH